MRSGLPIAKRGMTVGLLGGSFDPPHEGHVHITREALKRFGLDRIWWLVSPGNPLKCHGPAPMLDRLAAAHMIMDHPRVVATDIEARLGTRFTAETLERLVSLYPFVRFVWLMGADNLAQFHRWQRWQGIAATVPLGVLARPGETTAAKSSPAARRFRSVQLSGRQSALLAGRRAPAWCFINAPMRNISSTELRASGHWPGAGASP
ncbi:MAG: nicotinate-nucleotide adenylyltransferase [Pseudomonadota bacterium]